MGNRKYTPEFKAEAVRQVLERGYTVVEVATRLGISNQSLYQWARAARPNQEEQRDDDLAQARRDIAKLKADLRRAEEERDILKKAAAYFAREPG